MGAGERTVPESELLLDQLLQLYLAQCLHLSNSFPFIVVDLKNSNKCVRDTVSSQSPCNSVLVIFVTP